MKILLDFNSLFLTLNYMKYDNEIKNMSLKISNDNDGYFYLSRGFFIDPTLKFLNVEFPEIIKNLIS